MAREFITLDTRVDAFKDTFNSLTDKVGDLALLTTTGDSDLVQAINELDSDVGAPASLTTTTKQNIVASINEHDAELGTITSGAMGTTASTVSTAIKELDSDRDRLVTYTGMPTAITGMDNSTGNVLSTAVLNLDSALGNRSALTTTADQDVVVAINELDAELGTISAGAMGTTASTVSTAIKELDSDRDRLVTYTGLPAAITGMSNATGNVISTSLLSLDSAVGLRTNLTTTAKPTLVAAINELHAEMGNVTAGAMGTSASTIVTAIAEHETQINANKTAVDSDLGTVNASNMGTVAHTVVAAINELHTQLDTLDSDAAANPVGAITSLTTTIKSSIVNAINSLDSDVGTRTSLNTTADQNLVVAINEVSNRAINVKDSDGTLLNTA